MDRKDMLTVDEIWSGLQVLGDIRSHSTVERSILESRVYITERRKKLVHVARLGELFSYMEIMTHPDYLINLYKNPEEAPDRQAS